MDKGFNKKVILVFAFIVIIVGIIIFLSSSRGIQQEEFSTQNYSVKYDTTWKIKSSSDDEISFIHSNTQSTIDISIADLNSNLYGKTLKQIAQNIKSKVEKENPEYRCISEHVTYLNDDVSEAYQLLFEDGKRQSLIQIGMYGYKVFVSNYTAENKYFDILLDSVQSINSNFKIKYETLDMIDTRKIEETGYSVKTDDVDYSKIEVKTYRGAYYIVKTAVPVQFEGRDGSLTYSKKNEGSVANTTISFSSSNENLFTVYDEVMKNSKEYGYSKIEVQKVKNGDLEGYGIKGTGKLYQSVQETYVFLYALNDFNTLKITVSGYDVTQNLLDNIKVINYERYSNYIDTTIVDGCHIGTLNCENYYDKTLLSVDYKVPEKYKEIVEPTYDVGAPEKGRAFIIGKLRNKEITESSWATDPFYDYNITINIAFGSTETIANNNNLTYKKDVKVGDVTYKYYTSQYDSEGTLIKEAYYIADIKDSENNRYSYRIYVSSLDDIPESVLQDFASVKIGVESLE